MYRIKPKKEYDRLSEQQKELQKDNVTT